MKYELIKDNKKIDTQPFLEKVLKLNLAYIISGLFYIK